jgi:hypothetical protein
VVGQFAESGQNLLNSQEAVVASGHKHDVDKISCRFAPGASGTRHENMEKYFIVGPHM